MRVIIICGMNQPTDKPIAHPPAGPSSPPGVTQWSSKELFRGTREVLIEHFGVAYRLRITHANKLILTK
jgi:hemin uptake protein HemP